nr:zinc finger, CCHC-type [Tanacetum cinerariifolium]
MAAAMKHMASNFSKLEKFEGVDFKRWKKKMHFLLFSMSVVYVLTTPMPEDMGDNPTMDQVKTSKELWDILEAKYMAEDASSTKFLINNFINYKMTNSVLEQYNEILGMLRRFTQHKMNMDESIHVSCIIDKLPPLWKDFKHILKHIKEELTLVELGSTMTIQGNRKHHDTKANPKKKPKVTCWKCGKPGHLKRDYKAHNVSNKANGSGTKGSDDDVAWWVYSGATVHVYKDRCWFKTYESLNDGSILHMGNESTALVHGRGYVDLRPQKLWNKNWEAMSEDILHKKMKLFKYLELELSNEQIQNYCIMEIKELLNRHGRDLEALAFDTNKSKIEHQQLHALLNPKQRLIYEDVPHSVYNQEGHFYFVCGPGETGKTFLYNTVMARLRSERMIMFAVASSGIASLLLPGGRTAHSIFVIPLKLMENSTCEMNKTYT